MPDKPTPAESEHQVSVAAVDDDPACLELVELCLSDTGSAVRTYGDAESCLAAVKEQPVDIVITDLQMPGMDGLALLQALRESCPDTDVILVTGHADKRIAIDALRLGAYDFFEKPIEAAELVATIKRTVRYRSVLHQRDELREQLSWVTDQEAKKWGIDAFVGRSRAVADVLKSIRLIQNSQGTSVLITGESGTGKELVARAIHFGSPRATHPFVPVNCSAIPSELAESMLFGHTKGAFTGASADKKGCFEQANGGTVFLDEVGDMPPAIQIKLLRVLEDGVVVPVGSTRDRKVDVRVLAATNSDLAGAIENGDFRLDLFYRLAAYTIQLPPLRERKKDIPLLSEHFAVTFAAEMGFQPPAFAEDAIDALCAHTFPGNVRELKNAVERALLESGGAEIGLNHIRFVHIQQTAQPAQPSAAIPQQPTPSPVSPDDLPLDLAAAEQILIQRAMREAAGNVSAAARLLGINRTKLYRKLATFADKD